MSCSFSEFSLRQLGWRAYIKKKKMEEKMQYQAEELEAMQQEDFSFIYLTSAGCNVCKVLAPQVQALAGQFSGSSYHRIELDDNPLAKGKFMAFAIPTLVVYSSGQELLRVARHIDLREVEAKLSRYYQMIFQ